MKKESSFLEARLAFYVLLVKDKNPKAVLICKLLPAIQGSACVPYYPSPRFYITLHRALEVFFLQMQNLRCSSVGSALCYLEESGCYHLSADVHG